MRRITSARRTRSRPWRGWRIGRGARRLVQKYAVIPEDVPEPVAVGAGSVGMLTDGDLDETDDDEDAPEPQHRNISWIKLISALVLEGAIFRAVRGLFDHGARQAFQRLTGSWPGEEQPEQA